MSKSTQSTAFNTSANLENSTMATGLEKVSPSNPEEGKCQRMFKLPTAPQNSFHTLGKVMLKTVQAIVAHDDFLGPLRI